MLTCTFKIPKIYNLKKNNIYQEKEFSSDSKNIFKLLTMTFCKTVNFVEGWGPSIWSLEELLTSFDEFS